MPWALGRNVGPARLAGGYLEPTLNVRAIHGGDEGPAADNVIATVSALTTSSPFAVGGSQQVGHNRTSRSSFLALRPTKFVDKSIRFTPNRLVVD
jgi:hypothetical protein